MRKKQNKTKTKIITTEGKKKRIYKYIFFFHLKRKWKNCINFWFFCQWYNFLFELKAIDHIYAISYIWSTPILFGTFANVHLYIFSVRLFGYVKWLIFNNFLQQQSFKNLWGKNFFFQAKILLFSIKKIINCCAAKIKLEKITFLLKSNNKCFFQLQYFQPNSPFSFLLHSFWLNKSIDLLKLIFQQNFFIVKVTSLKFSKKKKKTGQKADKCKRLNKAEEKPIK